MTRRSVRSLEINLHTGLRIFEFKEARRGVVQYRKAVESNPEDADSFYAIETILSKQESSMKALPNFEKAVALDPTDAYNRSYYHGYLKKLGQERESERQWELQ
jgi:Tfp pilus assembly protein PilF